ncbi:MAG: hypothetical protein V3U14_12850 [candidate division NC10 bacterium]
MATRVAPDTGEANRRQAVEEIINSGSAGTAITKETQTTALGLEEAATRASATEPVELPQGALDQIAGIHGDVRSESNEFTNSQAAALQASAGRRQGRANTFFDALRTDVAGVNTQLDTFESGLQAQEAARQVALSSGGRNVRSSTVNDGTPQTDIPDAPSDTLFDRPPVRSVADAPTQPDPSITPTSAAAMFADEFFRTAYEQNFTFGGAEGSVWAQLVNDIGVSQEDANQILAGMRTRWQGVFQSVGDNTGSTNQFPGIPQSDPRTRTPREEAGRRPAATASPTFTDDTISIPGLVTENDVSGTLVQQVISAGGGFDQMLASLVAGGVSRRDAQAVLSAMGISRTIR